jgi:hypothetical protein
VLSLVYILLNKILLLGNGSCFHSIKKGYYILKFFIGVGNRDIMTKELSLICLFFVLFSVSIFFAWDNNLSHVNPMLPFKKGLFCLGMF